MDTGENKLSAEMMKKIYEVYKLHQKEDYEKFVEDCKKIIQVSDRGSVDTEDILKLVKGTLITDNHERRIHDYSIYKLTGRQVLNLFFDEPYPVMMPEDVKPMKEMSDEFMKNFQKYVSETLDEPQPMPGVIIQSLLSARHLLKDESSPRMMPVDFNYPANVLMYSISDDGDVTITGATQNFKPVQSYDNLKVLSDILSIEGTDRNGRIWTRKVIEDILNNRIYLITPRARKSWLWLKFLELQKSYEVKLQKTLGSPPSTKFELKSVIHMTWPKPALSNLKARDFRYGKMWQDQELINYATGDVSHIDMLILDSLATFGPDINSRYGLSTPNLNDIDKKKLERVIKRRKKK